MFIKKSFNYLNNRQTYVELIGALRGTSFMYASQGCHVCICI